MFPRASYRGGFPLGSWVPGCACGGGTGAGFLNRIGGGCCTGAKPGGFGAGFVGGVKMCGGVMTVFGLAAGAGLTGVENERPGCVGGVAPSSVNAAIGNERVRPASHLRFAINMLELMPAPCAESRLTISVPLEPLRKQTRG